jgi:hypothetical protein
MLDLTAQRRIPVAGIARCRRPVWIYNPRLFGCRTIVGIAARWHKLTAERSMQRTHAGG